MLDLEISRNCDSFAEERELLPFSPVVEIQSGKKDKNVNVSFLR